MFLQASVILSTGGSTWPGTPPGPGTSPLGPGTPPGTRYTPQTRYTPPGPDTPPRTRYSPPDQVHPRHRACWEIRSTRGRYASYWNAFLLQRNFKDNFRFCLVWCDPSKVVTLAMTDWDQNNGPGPVLIRCNVNVISCKPFALSPCSSHDQCADSIRLFTPKESQSFLPKFADFLHECEIEIAGKSCIEIAKGLFTRNEIQPISEIWTDIILYYRIPFRCK